MAGTPAPPPRAWDKLLSGVVAAKTAARAGIQAAYWATRGTTVAVAHGAEHVTQAAKDGAEAVATTAERAAELPRQVAAEMRTELNDWSARVAKIGALAAVVAVLGIFALITLTMGAVVGLNRVLGDPWGTLLVGAVYAIGTAYAVARLRDLKGSEEGNPTLQAARPPSLP